MYPGTQYLEIMRTSKKLASALLKALEPRLSVSADDIRALKEKTVQIVVPSMTKVRSFGGEGQHCSGSPYCGLSIDNLNTTADKRHTMPFVRPRIRFSYSVAREYSHGYVKTDEWVENLPDDCSTDRLLSSTEFNRYKNKFIQFQNDIKEFKSKLEQFNNEVHETIKKLNVQLKEDGIRYTILCYKLHHVTDLHQAQLQCLQSIVDKMESENDNKEEVECIISMLDEKIRILESRISRL